jgi:Protein of unknown function (DUF3455)
MKASAVLLGLGLATASTAALAAAPGKVTPKAMQFTGRGTQVYACTATKTGYGWVLKGPDAHMYDASGAAVARHYFGPRWQATDGSTIKGRVIESDAAPGGSADAPWLVLRTTVEKGHGIFGHVAMVTRTNTDGGGLPAAACDAAAKGKTASVPYSATYTFFPSKAVGSPSKVAGFPSKVAGG